MNAVTASGRFSWPRGSSSATTGRSKTSAATPMVFANRRLSDSRMSVRHLEELADLRGGELDPPAAAY